MKQIRCSEQMVRGSRTIASLYRRLRICQPVTETGSQTNTLHCLCVYNTLQDSFLPRALNEIIAVSTDFK
jgi:hypothetical protein